MLVSGVWSSLCCLPLATAAHNYRLTPSSFSLWPAGDVSKPISTKFHDYREGIILSLSFLLSSYFSKAVYPRSNHFFPSLCLLFLLRPAKMKRERQRKRSNLWQELFQLWYLWLCIDLHWLWELTTYSEESERAAAAFKSHTFIFFFWGRKRKFQMHLDLLGSHKLWRFV